jgi:hypothetical protein
MYEISKKFYFIILLLITYSVYDNIIWSNITQWQTDEGATMWLSLTKSVEDSPIGLISSVGAPNPNGMLLLGKFLNYLPSLWWVSFFLSNFQFFLILILGFVLFKKDNLFFIFVTPILFSVAIKSNSATFSNQFILASLNIIYFILLALYLNKPSSLRLAFHLLPIIFAPALYLGGAPNSLAFLICSLLAFYLRPFKEKPGKLFISFCFGLILLIPLLKFIWIPYFSSVTISSSGLNIAEKFRLIFKAILGFPYWSTLNAAGNLSGTFNHNGGDISTYPYWNLIYNSEEYIKQMKNFHGILSDNTLLSLKFSSLLLIIQSILSISILILSLVLGYLKHKTFCSIFIGKDKKIIEFLLLALLFIFLSFLIGVGLGAEHWLSGQRPDQQANFLPIFIIIWFIIPFYFSINQKIDSILKKFTVVLCACYLFSNIYSGYKISNEHLKYDGKILTNADVPLIHKQNAIAYIANDWKLKSNSQNIRVSYYLGGGRWEWVNSFGEKYNEMYQVFQGVYSLGREFDYEFLHSFKLLNSQEGIQHRSHKDSKYIICYDFSPPYLINNDLVSERKKFGRLIVIVLKN